MSNICFTLLTEFNWFLSTTPIVECDDSDDLEGMVLSGVASSGGDDSDDLGMVLLAIARLDGDDPVDRGVVLLRLDGDLSFLCRDGD